MRVNGGLRKEVSKGKEESKKSVWLSEKGGRVKNSKCMVKLCGKGCS